MIQNKSKFYSISEIIDHSIINSNCKRNSIIGDSWFIDIYNRFEICVYNGRILRYIINNTDIDCEQDNDLNSNIKNIELAYEKEKTSEICFAKKNEVLELYRELSFCKEKYCKHWLSQSILT